MNKKDAAIFYYDADDSYVGSVKSNMHTLMRGTGISFKSYDADGKQEKQNKQISKAIKSGISMIIVNLVDTSDESAMQVVEKAKTADIPVIFFNRPVSQSVLDSYDKCYLVGTDHELAAHMQGDLIGRYVVENYKKLDLNGDGVISYCLFKGQDGNIESEARTKYAIEDANAIITAAGHPALKFYDEKNNKGYLVDRDDAWSADSAKEYMREILMTYNEKSGNMVELIIANNDAMALGAVESLKDKGYNKIGKSSIPVFGIDAIKEARESIADGFMTGTVMQDEKKMSEVICKIAENLLSKKAPLDGVDKNMTSGEKRVNIPYSTYFGKS